MRGTYLYAVLAGEPHLDLGPVGLPHGTAPVTVHTVDGLTAVVSDYNGPIFEDLGKTDLLAALGVYQRVLELALAQHTILPVKFGSVLSSPGAVSDLLFRYRSRLLEALREVGDSVEIDLSATWDQKLMVADIAREPAVAALAGAITGSPEEGLAAQVRVGMLVHETLERRREEYRRRIVGDLVGLARDAEPFILPSQELVANLAFLVERDELQNFEAAVDRLGEELGAHLSFRYIGPLPPYSFATVYLNRYDPAQIESARHLLGLGEWVSESELQRTYRELAAQAHPDRNAGNPEAQTRFASLSSARDVLQAYLTRQREHAGMHADEPIDVRIETVADAILLEIRRSDGDPTSVSGVVSHG